MQILVVKFYQYLHFLIMEANRKEIFVKYFILSICLCFLALNIMAQNNEEQRIQQLQEKILQQQQTLQSLEEQLHIKETAYQLYTENLIQEYLQMPMVEESQGITTGYEKGFFVQSEDGNFKMKIGGHTRSHLYFYEANTTTNHSFRIVETRVDFHFYLFQDWHIRIRPDFIVNNGHGSLRDAFLEYLGWDCLRIRLGSWMTMFAMEHDSGPESLAIAFSPYATKLPGREVGIGIYGYGIPLVNSDYLSNHWMYAVNVFNGQGPNKLDDDDGKMFMATGRFFPLGKNNAQVYVQGALFYAETGFTEDGASLQLCALPGYEVFGKEPSSGVEDTDDVGGNTLAIETSLRYWKDNLRIEGEAVYVRYARHAVGQIPQHRSPLHLWGVSAGISYFFPIGKTDNKMGIEPLVKFSYSDIDDENGDGSASSSTNPTGTPGDVLGQSVWEIVLGVKFHANQHIRMDINWAMYDLERNQGITNNATKEGGGLIHAFICQWYVYW